MNNPETAQLLGSLSAKLDAIHEDVRELKDDIIPNGQARIERVEKHVDRTLYGFATILVFLAAIVGDRVYAILPYAGG